MFKKPFYLFSNKSLKSWASQYLKQNLFTLFPSIIKLLLLDRTSLDVASISNKFSTFRSSHTYMKVFSIIWIASCTTLDLSSMWLRPILRVSFNHSFWIMNRCIAMTWHIDTFSFVTLLFISSLRHILNIF